jgi:hypothetical protein
MAVAWYELRVVDRWGGTWLPSFRGFRVTTDEAGTILSGPVESPKQLAGVISELQDLGMDLVGLIRAPDAAPTSSGTLHHGALP